MKWSGVQKIKTCSLACMVRRTVWSRQKSHTEGNETARSESKDDEVIY